MTAASIAKNFNLSNEGEALDCVTLKQLKEAWNIMSAYDDVPYKQHFEKKDLVSKYRLMADFYSKIIECRVGTFDKVNPIQFQMMTAILLNIKIN